MKKSKKTKKKRKIETKVKKLEKKVKRKIKKHRLLITIIIVLAIIIFSYFGTQIYLYINFLLGNDIMVKLDANKENLFIQRGEQQEIEFKASVTTNPFCTAECNYEFIDISNNKILDKDIFTISPGNPFKKQYTFRKDELGTGQDLYRFDMECNSKETTLCHTSEEPLTRNILITLNYDLSDDNKILRNNVKKKLDGLVQDVYELEEKKFSLDLNYAIINNTIELIPYKTDYDKQEMTKELERLQELWLEYEFGILDKEIDLIKEEIVKSSTHLDRVNKGMTDQALVYNNLDKVLNVSMQRLVQIKDSIILNQTLAIEINETINEFNKALIDIQKRNPKHFKTGLAEYFDKKTLNIIHGMNKDIYDKYEEFNNGNKILCELTEECPPQISLELVIDDIAANISNVCTDLDVLNEKLLVVNQGVGVCKPIDINYTELDEVNLKKIEHISKEFNESQFEFHEHKPQCCIMSECNDCCTTDECRNNPSTYPTVLLHGHAFNKDLSAEYSLEVFNKIQDKLQGQGYINAGVITLYTTYDEERGLLGLSGKPVTLRTSYYFDIFKNPENYIVVQAKSENIDTYSIRLRDLVDLIKHKTNKPKVNIIAFSMGGLVARRYIQIFGEDDVNKLIMIGTPNKGITEEIVDYCAVIGESLECRDMNKDSLFMNKLSTGKQPKIQVYNIIGTGCEMEYGKGDGVALEENAKLDYAENFVIDGKCRSSTEPLHLDLPNIELYPKVYDIVLESLKDE